MDVLLSQVPATVDRWQPLADFAAANGLRLARNLFVAAMIFFVGRWLALAAGRVTRSVLARSRVDATAASFVADFFYATILVFAIVSALGWLGIDTTSIAAVVAAAGLAIGLALQGSLANFASGILLVIFKPFKVGDSIEIGTTSGTVDVVHVLATFLRTTDNVQICIPNSQVTQGIIKNYSAHSTRRIELPVNSSFENDLPSVRRLLEELLEADPRLLHDPKPSVTVEELGEEGFRLAVNAWVNRDDYADARADLIVQVKDRFDRSQFKLAKLKK